MSDDNLDRMQGWDADRDELHAFDKLEDVLDDEQADPDMEDDIKIQEDEQDLLDRLDDLELDDGDMDEVLDGDDWDVLDADLDDMDDWDSELDDLD
jgi:hypothetical protein